MDAALNQLANKKIQFALQKRNERTLNDVWEVLDALNKKVNDMADWCNEHDQLHMAKIQFEKDLNNKSS